MSLPFSGFNLSVICLKSGNCIPGYSLAHKSVKALAELDKGGYPIKDIPAGSPD
jgi:hypothetical protein